METDAPGPSTSCKVEETRFEEAADEADCSPDEAENVEDIDIKVNELPHQVPSRASNIWPADNSNDVVERRLHIDQGDSELNAAVLSLLADSRQQQIEPLVTSAVTSASSAMALQSQSVLQNGSNAEEGLSLEEEERAFRRQVLAVEAGGRAEPRAFCLPSRQDGRTALRARNRLATSMPLQLAAFGRYVAEELESMSVEKAVEVKSEIMKILLEAAAADL